MKEFFKFGTRAVAIDANLAPAIGNFREIAGGRRRGERLRTRSGRQGIRIGAVSFHWLIAPRSGSPGPLGALL